MALLAASAAQAQFNYTTNEGAITITGYTGAGGNVAIPATINGMPVTAIGAEAFSNSTTLASVTMPAGLKSIGTNAFAFSSVTNETIPASVTNLGQNVFLGCDGLQAINVATGNAYYSSVGGVLFNARKTTLLEYPGGLAGHYIVPGTVTIVGFQAFWSSDKLTAVTIPPSVKTIEAGAFAGSGLTNLTLADGVADIGLMAFQSCASLTSATIPASVTNLGPEAFQSCCSLRRIFFQGNAPAAGTTAAGLNLSVSAYYLPHTKGWGSTFAGFPTVLDTTNTLTVVALPAAVGARVTGAGSYLPGTAALVSVSSSNECYKFIGWTVGGKTVSTQKLFSFAPTANETLTANFAQLEYTNTTLCSPTNSGSVSGSGEAGCGGMVTLKATAKPGYGFTEWTMPDDASFHSSANPYTFEASGNATFVAHFKDSQSPVVKITTPGNRQKIATAAFVIEGTAEDNVGVAAVYYSLNGSGYAPAVLEETLTNWYAYISLIPNRTNTVSAYAVDNGGNVSPTNGPITLSCTAAGLAPISIAGDLAWVNSTNDSAQLSFGSAAYVLLNTNGSGSGEVGTYTYTLTGPNAAELVRQPALPTQAAEASVTELTFTNAYDATFSNNSGARGSFSIATAEQSVPPTLDGVQLFAEDSTTFGNISWTNIFGSSTFQERDSDRSNSFGIYTFTPFTPVAALVVLTYTNPPALDGVAEYLILSFTEGASPAAGQFYYQSVIPLAETASSFGSFKLSTNAVANKFAGPPTLAGLQAKVVPAGEPASFAYTTSFGLGTFAALYIPPAANPSMITNGPNEAGFCLSNPRVATDAGAATLLPMAPPTATNVDESFGLFWESATSALWTNSSSGKTSALTFSPAPYDVPAALTGQTITVTPTGSKIAQTVAFTYNTYTNNDGDAGTYTYAPYSPTMALVRLNSTNAAEGKLGQMLVNYETGAYVSSTTNSLGEWTMKSGVFKTK